MQRLETDMGKDWMGAIEGALVGIEPANLAIVLACAFDPPDPRADPAHWMEASPPINEAKQAIERGILHAISGDRGDAPENPLMPLPVRMWQRLVRLGFGMADRPENSSL